MFSVKKGFGLIELMVSILVASIIIAGLYQLVTTSWLNFGISSATARSGKSYRQVGNVVDSLLYQAGFKNYSRLVQEYLLMPTATGFGNNAFFVNNANWEREVFLLGGEEVNGNSSIKIRFTGASIEDDLDANGNRNANGFIFDCRGQSVPNTVLLEMLLFVNDQGLVCAQNALEGDNALWSVPVDNPVVIDSSVVAMKILYGTTLYGRGDVFYTSEAVDAGNHWPNINLIRYYFVTSQPTGQNQVKSAAGNVDMTLFDNNDFVRTSTPCPAEDRKKYYKGVDCRTLSGNNYNNFGVYTIPENARSRMHKVISGSVSLFNGYNFD